jgi:aminopeptidase N
MHFRLSAALLLAGAAFASGQSRPHAYDLKDVTWSVSLDPDHEALSGDVTNTLSPVASLSEIVLDCGPKLEIDSLTVNGEKRLYRREGDKLKIALGSQAKKGDVLKVRIVYHGVPEAGAYYVPATRSYPAHTPIFYTQGEMEDNRQWLPTYDYPDNKATSEGTIEVPNGWVAISNGKLLETTDKANGRKAFHWKMDKPHSTYLISFTAGPYVEGKEAWGDLPVSYWVPPGLEDQGKAAFAGTNKIVEFYSKLTGYRYPYVKFTQDVVPDYMFGGMENITAVTQSILTLHPASTEPIEHSAGLVAHELAHQWFGDTTTCHDWSHIWLNEGWASFLPSFWDREAEGQDAYDLDRYNTFSGGLSAHNGSNRPVVWTGYKEPIDMFDNFAYPGGASRMFMLMDKLGEERFWKAISEYLKARQFTNVTTEDFFADVSKSTGEDLDAFRKQWFYTPAAPHLKVSVKDSQLVVSQTQPYFDLQLPVWVLDFGEWVKKSVHLTGESVSLELGSMAGEPTLVDPECKSMLNIESGVKLTSQQKMAVYKAAPNAGEKARIMDTMLSGLDSSDTASLCRSETSLPLKVRWISRLGGGQTEFLLELLKDENAKIRNEAAAALGSQEKSDPALQALTTVSELDPNDVVRQTASSTKLRLTNDLAYADKLFQMDGYKDRYRQIALEWYQLRKPDLARTHAMELLANPTSEPLRVVAIRMLGQLKDKTGERDVYRALLKVVSEHSFNARVAAIGALADYGDKSALPAIQPLTTHPLVFVRNAAKGAVSRLGQ